MRIRTQVRYRNQVVGHTEFGNPIVVGVPAGLDYMPAIALLQGGGYDVQEGLEWLQVIEVEMLRGD